MLCNVKRAESLPDTSRAANSEAKILSEVLGSSQGHVGPSAGGGMGPARTLSRECLSPGGGAGLPELSPQLGGRGMAEPTPVFAHGVNRPGHLPWDSKLPDISSTLRETQGPQHGSRGHGWGEVLRTQPAS